MPLMPLTKLQTAERETPARSAIWILKKTSLDAHCGIVNALPNCALSFPDTKRNSTVILEGSIWTFFIANCN
jgi:hypothetical protein